MEHQIDNNGYENWENENLEPFAGLVPNSFLKTYLPEQSVSNVKEFEANWPDVPIGVVGFDSPASIDMVVEVLLPEYAMPYVDAGMMVTIEPPDGLPYLARFTAGPFTEPNGIPASHPLLVIPNTSGGEYIPKAHGRAEVSVLGHLMHDLSLEPCFQRPPPIISKVHPISEETFKRIMNFHGTLIGTTADSQRVGASYNGRDDDVLTRHTAIVGSTGAGKTLTGSRVAFNALLSGFAVIVLDREGDLAFAPEPSEDPKLAHLLEEEGLLALGWPLGTLYVMAGRATRNRSHPDLRWFSLQFGDVSPYVLGQISGLSEPMTIRWFEAYEITYSIMKSQGLVAGAKAGFDESSLLDTGYPGMTFQMFYDVVKTAAAVVGRNDVPEPQAPQFYGLGDTIQQRCQQANLSGNVSSWRALLGRIGDLRRANIFDQPGAPPLDFAEMLQPGRLSVFDLSDADELSKLSNLVISRTLRGVRMAQESHFKRALELGTTLHPCLIIVEEAQELIGRDNIKDMPEVFRQLKTTALRGRKRKLALVLTSQFPDRLPDEVIGLVHNWLIHRITNPDTVRRLRTTVGEVPAPLWDRLHTLKRGQAIAVFPEHWTAPQLINVAPPPFKVLKVT